ncbi:EamA-like transporter-like protein 1 [Elsinoe fawcettii]|nr:EamA-like transporter-like protein 1 [Elsinoe fawcettii]
MTSKAVIPFLVGMMLLTGVCNTLLTKYQDMQCVRNCTSPNPREHHTFEQPVIQTLQMFVGESGCWLVVFASYLVSRFSKSRGGSDAAYQPLINQEDQDEITPARERGSSESDPLDPTNIVAKPLADPDVAPEKERLPLEGWKILLLALPACCDIAGTTLMNVGLLFVAASIYQMTRGALVLFVGLFSVVFLKRHLGFWKWASLFIVVIGVMLVGLAGYLERRGAKVPGDVEGDLTGPLMVLVRAAKEVVVNAVKEHTALETIVGVLLIAGAQIFTASQFVLEESIMEKYSMEPIQVVGWEGVFGFSVTLIGMGILHLAIGQTPAGRYGYFDAREGFYEIFHNRAVAVSSLLIMISIGGFNFFGLSVTRSISATARSTIDTCRTLFIWLVSLGLGWETFKWLQVPGFALLVYGTGLFNEIIRPPTTRWLRSRIGSGQSSGGAA